MTPTQIFEWELTISQSDARLCVAPPCCGHVHLSAGLLDDEMELTQRLEHPATLSVPHLIQQMADAMMRQDDDAVVSFFADDAVMIAPSGRFAGKQAIYEAGHGFNQAYTNIIIKITEVIYCEGEKDKSVISGVVEWSFAETRRSDGWTHVMEDAIVFKFRAGKVTYWREYFDPNQIDLI